jgi:putative transposase
MSDTAPLQTTVPIRLLPTLAQAALLRAHAQEYIGTINVLVAAIDSGVLPDEGKETTTADFTAALPSAVKNQALRDARSVWKRALALGRVPVLRRPVCQWNNQNWRLEGATLVVPVHQNGQVNRITIRCAGTPPPTDLPPGGRTPGLLRITRKRNKWIAYVAYTPPDPVPAASGEAVMGVDLGIKVPAVIHVVGRGTRYLGNGRAQRARRRQFYARRKALQQTKKVRAVRKSRGKESCWMRDTNHKLSRRIVTHAQQQGVGTIRLEQLAGIRQRTTRPSGGAKNGGKTATAARKNNRMIATWTFHQLATFIAYKAARAGIAVEWVDPAYTSRTCPACGARNLAADRRYVCVDCGWMGHRDAVGAINISRRRAGAGRRGNSAGAAGA